MSVLSDKVFKVNSCLKYFGRCLPQSLYKYIYIYLYTIYLPFANGFHFQVISVIGFARFTTLPTLKLTSPVWLSKKHTWAFDSQSFTRLIFQPILLKKLQAGLRPRKIKWLCQAMVLKHWPKFSFLNQNNKI